MSFDLSGLTQPMIRTLIGGHNWIYRSTDSPSQPDNYFNNDLLLGIMRPGDTISAAWSVDSATPIYETYQLLSNDGSTLHFDIAQSGRVYEVAPPIETDSAANALLNVAAIQEQIDAAYDAGGGLVKLQPGTYYVKDQVSPNAYAIELKSGVSIWGSGFAATKIKMSSTETRPTAVLRSDVGVSNIHIKDLEVDGTNTRIATNTWALNEDEGINLKTPTDCRIENCYIHDCASDGIDMDTATGCMIVNCRLEDNGGTGIHLPTGLDCIVTGNTFSGNSYYNLQSSTESVRLSAGGVSLISCQRTIVSNNTFRNDERGILMTGCTRCVADGNTVYQPGAGSNVTGTSETDPATKDFDNAAGNSGAAAPTGGGKGIYLNACTQCTISNNTVNMRTGLNDAFGICVAGNTSVRNIITGNQVVNGRPNIYLNGCGQTLVEGNVVGSAGGTGNPAFNILCQYNVGAIRIANNFSNAGAFGGMRIALASTNVTISGNFISSPAGDGINVINDCSNIVMTDNTITGATDGGIELQVSSGTPTGCTIARNVFSSNATDIKDAGTATVILDNIGTFTVEPERSIALTTEASTSFTVGQLGYVDGSGTVSAADASAESTGGGMLVMSPGTVGTGTAARFITKGIWTTSGLTAGAKYYLSETAKEITATAPVTGSAVVRIVGYAISATKFVFNPDSTYTVV